MAVKCSDDVKSKKFWLALIAEFIGTLFLVLVACGSCGRFPVQVDLGPSINATAEEKTRLMPHDLVQISLAFGLSVGTIVWATAHVSGGHINPAVTIGFFVTRKISLLRAVLYTLMQSLGAMAGATALKLLSPDGVNDNLGSTGPGSGVTNGQAFFVELLITFVLVWTVFATCDSQRTDLNGSGPLAIGLSIAMCHLWAIPYTGSGMNPARALGSAVVSGSIDAKHWIYWAGPLAGGAAAGLLYDLLFAANAGSAKLYGFLRSDYDDSHFDGSGKRAKEMEEPKLTGVYLKDTV